MEGGAQNESNLSMFIPKMPFKHVLDHVIESGTMAPPPLLAKWFVQFAKHVFLERYLGNNSSVGISIMLTTPPPIDLSPPWKHQKET